VALLIDTYNVLHSGLPLAPDEPGADILHLAERIASSRFRTENLVTLVCDGVPPPVPSFPAAHRGCRILFAGAGREADALIEELIREDSAPARLLVVSSDRRILKAARKRRAKTLTSPAFLYQLAAPEPREHGRPARDAGPLPARDRLLKDGEVDQWMNYFGPDAAHADAPASPDPAREERQRIAPSQSAAEEQRLKNAPPPNKPNPGGPADPLLKKLLRESGAGITPDELDMERWLNGENT
jgi:uncharacterized protein